jgi:hypothetical protein
MLLNGIIPNIYSYNHIEDFDEIQISEGIYEKSDYIDKIHIDKKKCIYIMCMEKYDYDLINLYNVTSYDVNLFRKNKSIIEERLLDMFNRLINLRYIFFDMKLENVVVKVNGEDISDLKIIDIDHIYCLQYDAIFDMDKTNETEIAEIIITIYKQIFHVHSAEILFENNPSIREIYGKFCDIMKNTEKNHLLIRNLRKLLSMR